MAEKGRLLFLERYLLDHTDDNHSVTTNELIRVYEENGFNANRDTIRDDVEILNASGVEVLSVRVGRGKGYHVGARLFELAELKMLVDAVSSSRFITMGKSQRLIEQITKLTNEQNRPALTAKIFTADRIKSGNTSVFNSTDIICKAIDEERKIRFHYWNYNPQKEHVLRHDGAWFEASPYALIWDDQRYYLAAYSEFREKVVTFRVDRMCDVEVMDEAAVKDEGFNAAEFANSTFKMIDEGLPEAEVTLLCDNVFIADGMDKRIQTSKIVLFIRNHRLNLAVIRFQFLRDFVNKDAGTFLQFARNPVTLFTNGTTNILCHPAHHTALRLLEQRNVCHPAGGTA